MSTRISAAINLDTAEFSAGLTKVEAGAKTTLGRLQAMQLQSFSGKSAAESAGSIGAILAAEERLAGVRRTSSLARASDTQKVAILESEVAATRARIAALDGSSIEKVGLQIALEEKLLQVEQIRERIAAAIARQQEASSAAVAAAQTAETARLARIAELEALGASRRREREASAIREAAAAGGGAGRAGTTAAAGSAGGALGQLGGVLARTFNLGTLFKGLLVGAGIGTALQVIQGGWELITARLREAKEMADRVAAAHERIRQAVTARAEAARSQMSGAQQLADLQGQQSELQQQLRLAEEKPVAPPSGFFSGVWYRVSKKDRVAEGEKGAEIARISAELQENLAAQAELAPRVQQEAAEKNRQRLTDILNLQRQIAAEREQRALEGMSLEDQLARAKERQLYFDGKALAAKTGSYEQSRYSLEAEKQLTEQTRLRARIQEQANEAWDRALQAEVDRQREIADLVEKQDAARKNYREAGANSRRARDDYYAFSLDEAAGGTRGNSAARLAARGIGRDEATARRLRDFGGSVTLFDAGRQKNIEAGAEFFETRAAGARARLAGLNSAEQNPFAAADAALKSAGEKLAQAAADLSKVEVSVDVDS